MLSHIMLWCAMSSGRFSPGSCSVPEPSHRESLRSRKSQHSEMFLWPLSAIREKACSSPILASVSLPCMKAASELISSSAPSPCPLVIL